MGLCKCPKRRVTNQFCFEHRVNVCEYCMVTNHPKCIVQSYLQWLQDSDYNAICEICTKTLGEEECIRLTCYHIYHWRCVESSFRLLPRTTAPAGYTCPHCRAPLFPAPNLVSPVADVLRERLANVNWARAGLGLPLLSEDMDMKASLESRSSVSESPYGMKPPYMSRAAPLGASDDESAPPPPQGPPYSIVQVQDDTQFEAAGYSGRNDSYQGQAPRRTFEKEVSRQPRSQFDHDDDKYKRKSALEWILRWWKNTLPPARNRRSTGYLNRRYLMAFILLAIGAVTLIIVLYKVGRAGVDNDPDWMPENHPNIKIHNVASYDKN